MTAGVLDAFPFPANPNLNYKWRVAVRRVEKTTKNLWKPMRHSKVRSDHFGEDDYTSTDLNERKRLKVDAIPSIFPFNDRQLSSSPREDRAKRRRLTANSTGTVELHVPAAAEEVELDYSPPEEDSPKVETSQDSQTTDSASQCSLLSVSNARESIQLYEHDNSAVQYFTGFDSYIHFKLFISVLGPAIHHLSFKCHLISPEDQCFMTLMKLRQCFDDAYLSIRFKVSLSTVSDIINTWINFFFQLSEINMWPDRETIDAYMPTNFNKLFPNTRVILDATETPIHKPSRVDDQSVTFSTYKNKNTLKTMIGCSPRGLVTYVSDSYGGSSQLTVKLLRGRRLCSVPMFDRVTASCQIEELWFRICLLVKTCM
ncbi:PREDICTED: uncharacterized protein LOC106811297 [Priapulus caudatus]|uniref:Uncharacterized protein LOC106811297 n=1 Tax=Priapulus caudatus TaxID=37621 RepID=A0ABM1EDT3_PRICU|nr:PREDICTED: uncharacterized protein LOC106811297 [Priapulus caudatus]